MCNYTIIHNCNAYYGLHLLSNALYSVINSEGWMSNTLIK